MDKKFLPKVDVNKFSIDQESIRKGKMGNCDLDGLNLVGVGVCMELQENTRIGIKKEHIINSLKYCEDNYSGKKIGGKLLYNAN